MDVSYNFSTAITYSHSSLKPVDKRKHAGAGGLSSKRLKETEPMPEANLTIIWTETNTTRARYDNTELPSG